MARRGQKAVAKNDFAGMTLKQMLDLSDKLSAAIEEKRKEDREEAKRAVADFAEKRGFTVDDLFGGRKGKGRAVAPKYKNPDNPSETWTGRGRKPNWLVAKLNKGAKIDSFAI